MEKIEKMIRCILVLFVICAPFFNISAQDEVSQKLTLEKIVVVKKTIEENIQFMQQKLPDLIKALHLENKPEVIYDMGGIYKPESKGRFVYVSKVSVKFTGEALSEIHFTYSLSSESGIYQETQELVNKNPSDQGSKDLKALYKNSKGETEEFSVGLIKTETLKVKVLRIYLEHLNDFMRWLDFYEKKGVVDQDKTLHKLLRVSGVS